MEHLAFSRIPSAAELLASLTDLGFIGMVRQTDKFYTAFAERVGGLEPAGPGLALSWQLCVYDTLRDFPPAVLIGVDMTFSDVIDAMGLDPIVAAEAKEALR